MTRTYLFELHPRVQSMLDQTDGGVVGEGIQVVFGPNKSRRVLVWGELVQQSVWNVASGHWGVRFIPL